MLMLASISRNENNNGFDLGGLNFFSLSIGVWRFLYFVVVSCIVLLVACSLS